MLYLVFGRAGSGKTVYLHNLIADVLRNTDESPVLLVPEQFSFRTERDLLKELGAKSMRRVEVLSFTRLAQRVVREYATSVKPYITEAQRMVMMSLALEQLGDSLSLYPSKNASPALLSQLLAAEKECSQCCVEPEELMSASVRLGDCALSSKLRDTALICETFRACEAQSFFDGNTALDELCKYIAEKDLFRGRIVLCDSFRGFTGQEMNVMREILRRADAVYVTICATDFSDREDELGAFKHTADFAASLRALAQESSVRVAKPAYLSSASKYNNFPPKTKRSFSPAIKALEASLYGDSPEEYDAPADCIKVISAADVNAECEAVAREIKRVVRVKGFRCREITVIERTEGSYKPYIINALKRRGLPVFDDCRRSIVHEPLAEYTLAILRCAATGFTTEDVLKAVKTGIGSLTPDEVYSMDNYSVLWDIDGAQWKNEWTHHPEGYGKTMDSASIERLAILNKSRENAIAPVLLLKETAKGTPRDISGAVYGMLVSVGADAITSDGTENTSSPEAAAVWEQLMQLLEQMASLGGSEMTLSRYCELFELLCSKTSLGVIPQGLDEITVGSADRIRTDGVRAVFLVGVNEGVFPLADTSSGIFTDSDRKRLRELGTQLSEQFEGRTAEERFIAYCAMTAATDYVCLSYSRSLPDGGTASPSELVEHVRSHFLHHIEEDSGLLTPVERIEGATDALSELAISKDASLSASLRYVMERAGMKNKLDALDRAVSGEQMALTPQTAAELFGQNLRGSSSRVQCWYECPFKYYCSYGLNIHPLRKAELDPLQSGSVIHYVFEKLLSKFKLDEFLEMDKAELEKAALGILNKYLDERMGGDDGKSDRFLYLYRGLCKTVVAVLERLREELRSGGFVPCDFELKIGGESVSAYRVDLSDGSYMSITGSVDRVDVMERGGVRYIRVIDYKTGSKSFKLSDVLEGLNLQMCMYLTVLCKDSGMRYGENPVPAGVLYVPSRVGYASFMSKRNVSDEEVAACSISAGQMQGMILADNTVFDGMGVNGPGAGFLPAKVDKKGAFKGNIYSLADFGRLSARVDELLREMGEAIHRGDVFVLPVQQGGVCTGCEYCDYGSLCGFSEGMQVRDIRSGNHNAALGELEREFSQGTEGENDG